MDDGYAPNRHAINEAKRQAAEQGAAQAHPENYTGTSPINVKKLGHLVYEVSDVERSAKFWTEVMGFQVSEANEIGMVFLRCGSDHHAIGLKPSKHPRRPAASEGLKIEHLAFEVGSIDVLVKARGHEPEHFDAVFIACHSDQALRMLADPTAPERQVLGAIPYQPNEVVLHTDTSVLPRRRLAWAAWNYHIPRLPQDRVAVTYNMNILQRLLSRTPFLVTLNMTHAIDPAKIIKRLSYQHPMFTPAGVAAQQRQGEINGAERTYYCGAYWRNGFHEDGVVSALNAINHFQRRTQNAERHLYRVG